MLEALKIKNVAVINEQEIQFKSGLNVISGETGAGKSIIIQAISMILGSRASTDLIRSGCDEALVEGIFDLSEMSWMKKRLETFGFESDDEQLLIRRTIHRNGRNRIFINGSLATVSILQQVSEGLVDVCGQHEHQSLLKSETQIKLVDRFGGLEERSQEVLRSIKEMKALKAQSESLRNTEEERMKKLDFIRFQIEELKKARLEPGEDEKLQAEKRLLQSTELRIQSAQSARKAISGGDDTNGIMDLLKSATSQLRSLSEMDCKALALAEGMDRALAEVEDVDLVISQYIESIEMDPSRLEEVQGRLATIAELRRKYGKSVAEMLETLSHLEKEANSIEQMDGQLSEVLSQLEEVETQLYSQGKKLSENRKKVAELFSDSVTAELKDLKMSESEFNIQIDPIEEMNDWSSQKGADEIQFRVQTNRGEDSKPLGKIASGGELSRMMLAIRRVISDQGGIGVYLFDEIDSGMGGETAFEVGKKLKSVSENGQVLCITHLPQVASFAHHHLSVKKTVSGNRTKTEVVEVKGQARKKEIARMLGGPKTTKASLKNAAELLEMAR
ncbi:MAG: DNA repair protein RecN [Bdellovibrionaceae bacterium]|nr:DNA repair protein RecN [Pseudobdellovibrionaceae bacterium]